MNVIFSIDRLRDAVAPLLCGVSTRSTHSATEGILIQALPEGTCVLTTFDMEKGMRCTIEAQVLEEGSAILMANKFYQILRVMRGDELTLTVNEKLQATIVCGTSSQTMNVLKGQDFPEIPRLTSPNGFTMSQKVFREMIQTCQFAMASGDQRPVLNGLFGKIEGKTLTTVSCDSFKMGLCSVETDLQHIDASKDESALAFTFILPAKSVNELYKLLGDKTGEKGEGKPMTVYVNRRTMIFDLGEHLFFSKIIEGDYIDYNRILIRAHRITVHLERAALLEALERAALITEERVIGSVRAFVKLEFEGDRLKVSATSSVGTSYDEVPIEHEGEDLIIGFNNRYLMDTLRSSSACRMKLTLSTPLTSMNMVPDDPVEEGSPKHSEVFMLLPVRMKDS